MFVKMCLDRTKPASDTDLTCTYPLFGIGVSVGIREVFAAHISCKPIGRDGCISLFERAVVGLFSERPCFFAVDTCDESDAFDGLCANSESLLRGYLLWGVWCFALVGYHVGMCLFFSIGTFCGFENQSSAVFLFDRSGH